MAEFTVLRRGENAYESLRSGFNVAVTHDPDVIVDAARPADVVGAVTLAVDEGLTVAVMNTGHGPSLEADGGVLIRTGRMKRVTVDAARRTARVEAGASWRDVIDTSAPHGLAPLNGSSPHVGAVGYTLGGGVGLLARRFGFAADHVREMDLVTADGRLRRVSADTDVDLFWALRGAGANFGVVTAMEIDLFPVTELLGGELCFAAESCDAVLETYAEWAAEVPETMASSVMMLRYPDDPAMPPDLKGRHITHVRLAYSGEDLSDGEMWLRPWRQIDGCVLDTVGRMPYRDVGSIHHEPVDEPVPAFDRNILLRDVDHSAVEVLCEHAGPDADAPFLVELRAWGGALSRPAAVPNAVFGRDARFSLLAISDAALESRSRRDDLLDAMGAWGTGGNALNFAGVDDASAGRVRQSYDDAAFERLRRIKTDHDPHNRFRVNFNIAPHEKPLDSP
jgi:hypothetical protein